MLRKLSYLFTVLMLTLAGYMQIGAQEVIPVYPIPTFVIEEENTQAARLRIAVAELRELLCRRKEPVTAEWQERLNGALNTMILAEHGVIWAAAGDFASDEKTILNDQFFTEKAALLTLMKRLVADNPELQPAIDNLSQVPSPYTNAGAGARFGRGILTVYALRAQLYDVNKTSWQTMASISEGSAYKRLMDRALKALGELQFRLYIRGMQAIDQKIPADASFKFALHVSPQDPNEKLNVAVAQKFLSSAGVRGVEAKYLVEFDNEYKWQRLNGLYPAPLSGAILEEFKGRCPAKQLVLVSYNSAREDDARKAEKILQDNNYDVQLNRLGNDVNIRHKGLVYYQRNGSHTGADLISQVLRSVEVVNPLPNPEAVANPVDYSVWITKKPDQKGNLVRVNFTAERQSDAARAIVRLQAEGYKVTPNVVGYDANKEYNLRKLLVLKERGGTSEEGAEIANIVRSIEPLSVGVNSTSDDKNLPAYDLFFVAKKEEVGIDLNGTWFGYNYNCPQDRSVQEIRFTQTGDEFIAIKVSGNKCVGNGEVTLRGRITGNVMTGEQNHQIGGGTQREFRSTTFKIENKDLIIVRGEIQLRRRVN